MSSAPPDWDERYRQRDTPWDSGLPSRELARVLDAGLIAPCRAVELGCGTGTNAIYLAQRGFDVSALDVSAVALEQAERKAAAAGVNVGFRQADLCRFDYDGPPFEFVFDRGCYHCARRVDLAGFKRTLRQLTAPGTRYLALTGNAREDREKGPPALREDEIRADLGDLFAFEWIEEFRFQDPGGVEGPLGWSCLMVRRAD